MVLKEDCFAIAPFYDLAKVRKWEKQFKLTSGTSYPPQNQTK